jgi:hypothetical protein
MFPIWNCLGTTSIRRQYLMHTLKSTMRNCCGDCSTVLDDGPRRIALSHTRDRATT